jgi:hypothetical protein
MIKKSSCESEAVPYVLKFRIKLWTIIINFKRMNPLHLYHTKKSRQIAGFVNLSVYLTIIILRDLLCKL